MNTAVHDFKERLAFSQSTRNEDFWLACYKVAFPDNVGCFPTVDDSESQRKGVDRLIHMATGKTLYIDEKVRETYYPDILLEYVSSSTTNSPGWVEKQLLIDYLAYAFLPTRTVYLLPWLSLQRAWRENKGHWLKKYGTIRAHNRTYDTLCCPVPTNTLFPALNRAMRVIVPEESEWE